MPRRTGTSTNPYLVPVYNTTRHPCYKPPRNHVAARALMQVVGTADIKSEDILKIMDYRKDHQYDYYEDEEDEEQDEEEENLEQETVLSPDSKQHHEQSSSSSLPRLRISQAQQFADQHRKFCSECRFEHNSIIESGQKKLFLKEYNAREAIITEEYEIRRNELKIRYMERHIQILRYLEATRKQRERAMRQAQREENQRRFDAEESEARTALVDQILNVDLNKNLIEAGIMNILNLIMMEERIERKDYYKTQRAERHMVTIASHLRAEKLRRLESASFSLVKSEPNARRLVEAEWQRAVQKLENWHVEGKEIVAHVEHANRLRSQARARAALEKQEMEERSTTIHSAEIFARDDLNKKKAADKYRIFTEQLIVKGQEIESNENSARRQMESMLTRQRVQLFLKMLPSVEAGKRYEVRFEAWEALKEICFECNVDL